jgi:hypothetical protein
LVILIQQTLRNGFALGDFSGFHGKVFLRVRFRFLLIEWVLGTKLLAKGSSRGAPTGCVLPDCLGKTSLTVFPNRSDRFSPVGCREGFLSKGVSVVLWLLLFKGGKALEVFWVSGSFGEFLDKTGLTGLPNRCNRFLLPV